MFIKHKINKNKCGSCGLHKDAGTPYLQTWAGGPDVRVLIVALKPTQEEDDNGLTFSSEDHLLVRDSVCEAYGSEKHVAYAYLTKCHGQGTPSINQVSRCKHYLKQDIEKLQPSYIVALGGRVLRYLTGVTDSKNIWKARHNVFSLNIGSNTYRVVATPSPRRLNMVRMLRHADLSGFLVADLRRAYWGDPFPDERTRLVKTVKGVKQMVDILLKQKTPAMGFDTETTNLNKRYGNRVLTLQFCSNKVAYVVPLDHKDSPFQKNARKRRAVIKQLRRLFTTPNPAFKRIIAHNAQFDIQRLFQIGIRNINRPVVCTMLAEHALDEARTVIQGFLGSMKPYSLDALVQQHLGLLKYDPRFDVKEQIGSLEHVSLDKVAQYGGNDAILHRKLFLNQVQRSRQLYSERYLEDDRPPSKGKPFFRDFVRMCDRLLSRKAIILATLEYNGFPVDKTALKQMMDPSRSAVIQRMEEIKRDVLPSIPTVQQANKIAVSTDNSNLGMKGLFYDPWVFDPNKRLHAAVLYFGVLGLEPKNGEFYDPVERVIPAVDKYLRKRYLADEYRKPRKEHPWDVYDGNTGTYYKYPEIALIDEYSNLYKSQRSFVASLWRCMDEHGERYTEDHQDERVRASFRGNNTVTGRNASMNPMNAQNIPRADSPPKKAVKNLFMAPEGSWLINVDFSSAEVRWLAIASGDPILCNAFRAAAKGWAQYYANPTEENYKLANLTGDIHKQNASMFYQVPVAEVTKDLRQVTKTIVFGRIYGRGVNAIAEQIGVSKDEAKALVRKFDEKYHVAMGYIEDCAKQVRQYGYVRSPLGRRRRLWYAYLGDEGGAARADRQSGNFPIQSIASDANDVSMYELIQHINRYNLAWEVHNMVHDSCIFSVPMNDDLYKVLKTVEYFFTTKLTEIVTNEFNFKLKAPVAVDFDIGLKWGALLGWKGTREHLVELQTELLGRPPQEPTVEHDKGVLRTPKLAC